MNSLSNLIVNFKRFMMYDDVDLLKTSMIDEKTLWKGKIKYNEEFIQMRIIEYLEHRGILFHPSLSGIKIHNFGILNKIKKIGIRKGYPDLAIYYDNGKDKCLLLELKTLSGVLSKEQKNIISLLRQENIAVSVSYGLFDALYKINMYMKGEPILYT